MLRSENDNTNTDVELFPSHEVAIADHSKVYSDHVPVLFNIKGNNIVSCNIMGYRLPSGFYEEKYPEIENSEMLAQRHRRIALSLGSIVKIYNVQIIGVQEADDEIIGEDGSNEATCLISSLLEQLPSGWGYCADKESGTKLITFYDANKLKIISDESNIVPDVGRLQTLKFNCEGEEIIAHHVHTFFSKNPEKTEKHYRALSDANPEALTIIFGDTNTCIIPTDTTKKRVLTTTVIPLFDNKKNGVDNPTKQIPGSPDGCFYCEPDSTEIIQVNGKTLVWRDGTIYLPNAETYDSSIKLRFQLACCLDGIFKPAHEYQSHINAQILNLKKEQGAYALTKNDEVIVRIAANSINERRIAIRFSCKNALLKHLQSKLSGEESILFQPIDENDVSDFEFPTHYDLLIRQDMLFIVDKMISQALRSKRNPEFLYPLLDLISTPVKQAEFSSTPGMQPSFSFIAKISGAHLFRRSSGGRKKAEQRVKPEHDDAKSELGNS